MTDKWVMPAEWQPHERTWMAWPQADYTLGETPHDASAAYTAWANVANAIVEFEPVTMLVGAQYESIARAYLNPKVRILLAELNDGWMRDIEIGRAHV